MPPQRHRDTELNAVPPRRVGARRVGACSVRSDLRDLCVSVAKPVGANGSVTAKQVSEMDFLDI
jgi:hypothetical protein